jgi:hypothetical protein
MRLSPMLRLAGVVPVAAVLLAACATTTPVDAVSVARRRTVEAETARVVGSMKLTHVRLPATDTKLDTLDVSFSVDGVVDFARNRLHYTQRADIGRAGLSFEIIADDHAVYLKHPTPAKSGKTWLKTDITGVASGGGAPGQILITPSDSLALLTAVSSDVERVGAETLRDAPTTHYTMTIDPRKVLAQQDLTPEQRKGLERALAGNRVEPFPADAWIDGDGRLRKLRYTLHPGDAATVETSFELFDFGEPGPVELPPASSVATPSDLVDSITGSLGDDLEGLTKGLRDLADSKEAKELLDRLKATADAAAGASG